MEGSTRQSLEISGVETIVYSLGSGPPLVFLHGAGTFPGFDALRGLADGHRLIIPYHPGFGESGDDPRIRSVHDYVSHYVTLFDRLGLATLDLIGFSLGGWIAAEIAAYVPHRVARLILVAPAGLDVPAHPVPDMSQISGGELPAWLTHDPAVALGYFPPGPDAAFGAAVGREMGSYARILGDQPQGDPDLPPRLALLTMPVLLLWGAEDRLRPTGQAAAWQRLLPAAQLTLLPDAGHLLFEESPAAVVAAKAFLDANLKDPKAMTVMQAGITRADESYEGAVWNILGQTYTLKQESENAMSWHAVFPPGTFVPPHIHPTQDEFIYMLEGRFDLWLDGQDIVAEAGDLIRMPMNQPHGIFNKSDSVVRCMFWVSPTRSLRGLFERIHNLTDPVEVVRIASEHEVHFLPPPA
jgi:pimeloyl-ACP methyl ester carboxylesterase/mannose-6-phosphate isomerase-like protein (cupin superfamily)